MQRLYQSSESLKGCVYLLLELDKVKKFQLFSLGCAGATAALTLTA